jgi:hypothetical protein
VPPGPQSEELKKMFTSDDGRGTIRRNLRTSRTLARLVEIATQDGSGPKPAKKAPAKRKKGAADADTPAASAEGAEDAAEPSE